MSAYCIVELLGQPRGKGRPRFGRAGAFVRVWTDKKTMLYEERLSDAARSVMDGRPMLVGACSIAITAGMAIPVSWPSRKRSAALAGDIQPTGTPDFDNIAKIVGDGLNGIVWKDDAQVIVCTFRKFYTDDPSLHVAVWEWNQ